METIATPRARPASHDGVARKGRRPVPPVLLLAALTPVLVAACGGGPPSSTGATDPAAVVTAPALTQQGCTYTVHGSVPAGEPHGINPRFAPFAPDASATSALRSIAARKGTAMVDGTGVPAGTPLRSGPAPSAPVVAKVPAGDSVLVAEPVVWTSPSSGVWLAFFLACGGPNLYWAGVGDITHVSRAAGNAVTSLLAELAKAPPYTTSYQASLLPVTVTAGHLAWTSPAVHLVVGRGMVIQSA